MAFALALGLPSTALANQGVLDRSFGTNGRVLADFFGGGAQQLNALAVQRDPATGAPKIVAAGSAGAPTISDRFALARYDLDGTLDMSFGPLRTGKVVTSFSIYRLEPPDFISLGDQARALAVDELGRIVAAGSSFFDDGQSCRFAVARYEADGSPDLGFGHLGRVLTNVNSACDLANAVALQRVSIAVGGRKASVVRIVAAGNSGDPGTPPTASVGQRFTLARYEEDGRLDASFGAGGVVRSPHFSFLRKGPIPSKVFSTFNALPTGSSTRPSAGEGW